MAEPGSDSRQLSKDQAEVQRLRGIVERQHREIETYRRLLAESGGGVTRDVHIGGDSRAARPRLAWATLADVIAHVEAREALRASGVAPVLTSTRPPADRFIPVLVPSPGWGIYESKNHGSMTTRVYSLFGKGDREIGEAVGRFTDAQQLARNVRPVFLVNRPVFSAFRAGGFAFEYLPFAISDAEDAPVRWLAFLSRRLEIIIRKWNVTSISEVDSSA